MSQGTAVLFATALLGLAGPSDAHAQAVDLDFAVEQAFTTLRDMGTPTGYRTGIALPGLLGPVGVELGYRSVSEYLGERPEHCGMDVCTPGPFDTVMRMRSAVLGLSLSRMLNPFVEFSLGGTATLTWQDTEYGPAVGAEPVAAASTETAGPDLGGGAFATWRFPPLVSVLRPFLYARAEWIRGGPCAADAPCFGTRYLGSAGIGLYARIP
ncbi:MAG: hypothetical protein WD995_09265 [Gemmatimonadota bacterium]